MSSSSELQQLIFETLTGNGAIMALANGVYDRVPTNPFGEKTAYISFGSEDANEDDAEGIDGDNVGPVAKQVWHHAPVELPRWPPAQR